VLAVYGVLLVLAGSSWCRSPGDNGGPAAPRDGR
jgi:hypothetical protein